MAQTAQYELGMLMPTAEWIDLNDRLVFENPELRKYVAPFPPPHLMQVVSGLTSESDFAAHGTTIYRAVQSASPATISSYKSILDFGCGCARLDRMFKGHPGVITGCDIDGRLVDWINEHLSYMHAVQTQPNALLPFDDSSFDAVISISVFTHLNEDSQKLYLSELSRITQSGAYLFLTIHGSRALERALTEERIFKMLEIPQEELDSAATGMRAGVHNFIIQRSGHLTSGDYEYGITFIPETYVRDVWGRNFEIIDIVKGAIHDFQDIVVCRRR
jgi:SAM-dependent methyltransferase